LRIKFKIKINGSGSGSGNGNGNGNGNGEHRICSSTAGRRSVCRRQRSYVPHCRRAGLFRGEVSRLIPGSNPLKNAAFKSTLRI
jgi:hypothetical protein